MTVAELIAQLKTLPPETEVRVRYETHATSPIVDDVQFDERGATAWIVAL